LLRGIDKERLVVFSDEAGGTMAEVGLLPFARVALQVATQVLPPYRTRFSKHQFTQPQLLAVLCLMRYEDWTFREAEVRLREHQELRAALHLPAVPDYTTLYRFLRRLEDDAVDRGLQETVRRLRRRRSRPVSAAIDGTGLSDTSVSTFFLRRLEQHAHGPRPRRPWLKWLIVVDVQQQILLAQRARQGPGCDARSLPGLLDVAARGAPLGVVLADAEFDSEANHQHIRQHLGAKSIIPARRRGVPNGAIRNQMFRAFPKKPYRQRSKIESVFSAVKRKLSSRAPGRSLATQIRQALLLGLAYNIYRLRHRFAHGGCQQSLSVDSKRLTVKLSSLDATLTKNRGRGSTTSHRVNSKILTSDFSLAL
jgi:IS5 family transposase